jgi:hypothetical protein
MRTERTDERRIDVLMGSVALARVIDEVRGGDVRLSTSGYNRTYNRHNR